MKLIILGLVLAICLATPTIREEATTEDDSSDFGCKMSMVFGDTSTRDETDTHIKFEWSEAVLGFQEGSEYNACWITATFNGDEIEFQAEPATKCYRSVYEGSAFPALTEIPQEDFKVTCKNKSPVARNLDGYTCTLFFDKGDEFGIADGQETIWFDQDAETSFDTSNVDEMTGSSFLSNEFVTMTFGDDKCAFANLYSAFAGLSAIAALAFF